MKPRRGARMTVAAIALSTVVALAGCTPGGPGKHQDHRDDVVLAQPEKGLHQLTGNDPDLALESSQAFFEKAPAVVVLGKDGDAEAASARARELGVPLLLAPTGPAAEASRADFEAELQRLGARSLIAYGTLPEAQAGGLDVVDGANPEAELPAIVPPGGRPGGGFAVLARPETKTDRESGAALATAQAAGADLHTMASPDPRADGNLEFFHDHKTQGLYMIGNGFGEPKEFAALAATAAGGRRLPGGGQTVFPQRRMVALYGTPGTPSLGLLGEHDVEGAIKLAKERAAQYQPYSKEKVQPAFEIIATVASATPGKDGTYSSKTPVEQLEPWIKAAQEAGVYVVLDLQPGRNDFTTQARHYEKLLSYPNVGIAYDAEWRLKPGQLPLQQIGSVDAAELDEANDWLAGLTREKQLPQKVVILHQFKLSMIHERSTLDTSHPELSILLHADGNGTPGMKMATWKNLRQDLPEGIRMAWKNFIDEDSPTFTPKQTFDIDPKPWFVSYQ